jgi:ABC-type Zn2+ transport system substrate-binding protein/surface adhesin
MEKTVNLESLPAKYRAELEAYNRRLAETERKKAERMAALADPLFGILRDLARAQGVAYRYAIAHGEADVATMVQVQRGAVDTLAGLRGWTFPALDEQRGRPRQG